MDAEEYAKMDRVEDRHWWYVALHAHICRAVETFVAAGALLLDCGCGTGGALSALRGDADRRSVRMIGIDYLESCCTRARSKAGCATSRMDSNSLAFADGSFDAIIMADLIYHRWVDPMKTLSEVERCTRRGGLVVLNAPAYQWLHSAHDDRVGGGRRYTLASLHTLLRGYGFEIQQATYWNTFLFPVMVASRKILNLFRSQSDVPNNLGLLDSVFSTIMATETALIGRGVRMPFGGSVFVIARKTT